MEQRDYVLVIDSGNGGEYTLSYLIKQLPHENFLFFKDDKNCPYGGKNKKTLLRISVNNINYLLSKYKIKCIVFACNTLSCVVLKDLQQVFKDIYLLGISPNIDNAIKNNEKTLVLSTKSTLKLGKINVKYKNNKNIKFIGFKNLAKLIDDNIYDLNSLKPFLKNKLRKYCNYHNIVLGCTHFNLIKPQLKQVLNNEIVFFDASLDVAKKLNKTLKILNLKNRQQNSGKVVKLNSASLNIY